MFQCLNTGKSNYLLITADVSRHQFILVSSAELSVWNLDTSVVTKNCVVVQGLFSVMYLFLPSTNHKNQSIYFSNRRHKGMWIIEVGQWLPANYAFKSHSALKSEKSAIFWESHCLPQSFSKFF